MNTCEKCHKEFKSEKGYILHMTKNICVKQNRTCTTCNRIFTDKRSLEYHITHVKCTEKITLRLKDPNQIQPRTEHEANDELRSENLLLKGEIKALKENPQIVNNTNQTINIMVPPAFLSPDNGKQLTKQLPNLLHIALSKHPANCISYLIQETNCNPNMPLYNSIKITNKKDPYAQISDGDKFIFASKKKIIAELIENKRHILQEYVDNNGDKYGEKILRRYQNYVDFLDDDKETQKDLEIDIICMLLNISDLIGSDEWSKKLLADLKTFENN
jgi:hypothetical protein